MKKRNLIIGIACVSLSVGTVFAAGGKYISLEKAETIAKNKVVGGTVVNTEFEYEAGRAIYDIDMILNQYEYDLKLDATTGKGISIRKELRDEIVSNTTSNVTNKAVITSEEAKAIALKQVAGATVVKIELDREDNVYEIELRKGNTKYDVEISASNGAVLKVEIDD